MIEKICLNCGKTFSTYPSTNQAHCSAMCAREKAAKDRYQQYKQTCRQCGVEFLPKRPRDGGHYCSYRCTGLANRKTRINRNGYWYTIKTGHPRATKQGYVAVHVLVMEKSIGRNLRESEVVHHVDRNGHNNDLGNLVLMEDKAHRALHLKVSMEEGTINSREQRARAAARRKRYNDSRGRQRDGRGCSTTKKEVACG